MNLSLQQKREILEEISLFGGQYTEWGSSEEILTSDFSKLVTNSGWESDFILDELTVVTNKFTSQNVPTQYKNYPGFDTAIRNSVSMSYPAYYRGKKYMIIPGGAKSYFTARVMNIEHKLIPPHIKIVAEGRVHYLLEPFDKLETLRMDVIHTLFSGYQSEANAFRKQVGNEYGVEISNNSTGFKIIYRNDQPTLIFIPDDEVYYTPASKSYFGLYTLPDVDRSQIDEIIKWIKSFKEDRYEEEYHQYLEVLMALASKKLLPRKGIRSPEILVSKFIEHLDVFGYLRPGLDFYDSFVGSTFSDPKKLSEYQRIYNNETKIPLSDYNMSGIEQRDLGAAIVNSGEMSIQSNTLVVPEPKEINLDGDVLIDNVSFSRQDLVHLFFNTPLEQLAEYGGETKRPIWMTNQDLQLVHGFIDGEVMPLVLYKFLSKEAFNNLSYKGSLLNAMENQEFKFYINMVYKRGISPREYVKSTDLEIGKYLFTQTDVSKINQLREFIVGESVEPLILLEKASSYIAPAPLLGTFGWSSGTYSIFGGPTFMG